MWGRVYLQFIHIHLKKSDSRYFLSQLNQEGCNEAAWSTPWSSEINNNLHQLDMNTRQRNTIILLKKRQKVFHVEDVGRLGHRFISFYFPFFISLHFNILEPTQMLSLFLPSLESHQATIIHHKFYNVLLETKSCFHANTWQLKEIGCLYSQFCKAFTLLI